jgi:hypothetical protein
MEVEIRTELGDQLAATVARDVPPPDRSPGGEG